MFFTDARTHADLVVGPVDGAWSVVMGTVGTERGTTVLPYQAAFEQQLHDLRDGAPDARAARPTRWSGNDSPDAWIGLQLNRYNNPRMLTRLVRDGTLGPEASLSKLFWSHWHRDLGESMMDLLGADAMVVGEGYALDPFQGGLPQLPRRDHLRRRERDPAEHRRRACARPSQGTALVTDAPSVGIRPPLAAFEHGTGPLQAFVEQVDAAGLDHLCVGDHVSFRDGYGYDGLVQADCARGALTACPCTPSVVPRSCCATR